MNQAIYVLAGKQIVCQLPLQGIQATVTKNNNNNNTVNSQLQTDSIFRFMLKTCYPETNEHRRRGYQCH